jgi:hypothetical protein
MSWELRGFAESGVILFRLDGKIVNEEDGQLGLGFEGAVFADGVLTRVAVTEGETIYFAGPLGDHRAVLCYTHRNGTGGFNFSPPQDAAGSIVKKGDTIVVTLDIRVLDQKADKVGMDWVNALPHGKLTGVLHDDLALMARSSAEMAWFWSRIMPAVKADTVTGSHIDEMMRSKLPSWDLGLPYYGCLAWLFAHLWETPVFNTPEFQFKLDGTVLSWSYSPLLLPKHQPSRN